VVHPGQTHQLNIHVVSDLRDELTQATVSALVTIGDSVQQWRWSGNIAADDCTRVGHIDIVIGNDNDNDHLQHNVSDHSESVITIDLTLECGDVVATNRYTTALTN
jgi:hypothetical protein